MQVVISNRSKLNSSPSKITISNLNNVGRVTFGKIAKVGSVGLTDLSDVSTSGQLDGDVLVYNANTNVYQVKTLPKVDGGTY